ncbi:glycosyltransferase [bacterium]|nr:glycosyltransferase [bacterium]
MLTTSDEKLLPATDSQAALPGAQGARIEERSARAPVIGALGSLAAGSGHETLLRAAAILRAHGLDFSLLIVGEGPGKAALFARASELALLERTILAGDLPGRGELFSAISIFVAPGARESFGHDLLEAMARALPIVAVGAGATFEQVEDGLSGLLVPDEDASALASALARLLANPAEARALGERARAAVGARFPVKRLVDETLEAYERAGALRR